jgi:3-hydroxyisobutyrate dehydrogenase-like beta-hydroxyacid dehydrogenase
VVRDVLLGEHGVAPHARAGTMVIDMSTTGPEADVACAEALATRGIDLIDGPVGKGTWAAGKGELIILAGGTSAQIEKARWLLELLGSEVLHCGPLGSGQVVKLANNIATCANLAAALEAYQLVQRSGANVDALLNVMRQTAADSWQLNNTVARALQEDYSLGFKGSLALKDLQLALAVAQATGADVPTTAGTLRWYERSVAAGDGDRDLGAIFKLLNQAPGAPAR